MKRFVLGSTLLATVAAGPVRAQTPPAAEIAGGYQWMRDADQDQAFPRGWFLSGAAVVSTRTEGRVSIIGELGESRFDEQIGEGALSLDYRASQLAYLGGVRYGRRAGAIRPFFQVLAGVARLSAAFEGLQQDFGVSDTVLAVQPGGGADFIISDRVAVRLKADYRYLGEGSFAVAGGPLIGSTEDSSIGFDSGNAVRVGAGLVVAF